MAQTSETAESTGKAVLLFDGDCPMCRASVRLLKRLDWLKVFRFQSARSSEPLPVTTVALNRERLLEEMHLVAPAGAVYHGFRAFRWIAWRVPLLVPIAPLMYLPGMPMVGQRLYLWIAKNRFNLVPCRDDACALPRKNT